LFVDKSYYADIIEYNYQNENPVDITLSEIIKHKAIIVSFIATQKNFGYSDVILFNNVYPLVYKEYVLTMRLNYCIT